MKCTAPNLAALLFLGLPSLTAQEVVQTDWSGGAAASGPTTAWGNRFDTAVDISWRAVPGQLALSSTAIPAPQVRTIDGCRPARLPHQCDRARIRFSKGPLPSASLENSMAWNLPSIVGLVMLLSSSAAVLEGGDGALVHHAGPPDEVNRFGGYN